jgi:drug/metabolite transporter (DMT)-like permease
MPDLQRLRGSEPLLGVLSVVGFFGLNGVFLYYALFRPDVMSAVQGNPIALVFIIEAFVLVFLMAWFFHRLEFRRPGWVAFVLLSLAGSLAFSVPFFLLLHLRKGRTGD